MFIYKASDKIVFNILSKINYGYLEITSFDGNVFKFGNPEDNLKANLIIKKPNFNLSAYIKEENVISKKVFENAGYHFHEMLSYKGFNSFHYRYKNN